jgi:hypothetical protein
LAGLNDSPAFLSRVLVNEGLETLCAKVKELGAFLVLLFFREPVFGLRELEFAFALHVYEANSEICST